MFVALLLLALAAPLASGRAAPDSQAPLPGSTLRLGWTKERLATAGNFVLGGGPSGGALETREGPSRWFGTTATATIELHAGVVTKIRLHLDQASPRLQSYAEDELRRSGYRRVSWSPAQTGAESEWLGRTRVLLVTEAAALTAEFQPAPQAVVAPVPVAAATATPADTLDFRAPADTARAQPVRRITPAAPARPPRADAAGVYGRVMVDAVVDTLGLVSAARISRGIAPLDSTALDWARGIRFEPYRIDGRARPFRVGIPVLFLPGGGPPAARTSE